MALLFLSTLVAIAAVLYHIERTNDTLDDDNTAAPPIIMKTPVELNVELGQIDENDIPDELQQFFNRDPDDLFKEILPMPSSVIAGGGVLTAHVVAPTENQAVGTTGSGWLQVTNSAINFVDCATGSEDCNEFVQGKLAAPEDFNEPPENLNGTSIGASLNSGVAPWKVVTYFKRGSSGLTSRDGKACIITDINNSTWASGWNGRGTPVPPQWIGPSEILADSEFVTGYDLVFGVNTDDLIYISADYMSSGSVRIVIQKEDDDSNVANLAQQDDSNAKTYTYNISQGVYLNEGSYHLRVAVQNNSGGPAVFWVKGTIASITPQNLLVFED